MFIKHQSIITPFIPRTPDSLYKDIMLCERIWLLNSEAEQFWRKRASVPQGVGWVFSGASWFLFILPETRTSDFGVPFSREPLELPETWSQLHNIPVKIEEGWNNFVVSGRVRETQVRKLVQGHIKWFAAQVINVSRAWSPRCCSFPNNIICAQLLTYLLYLSSSLFYFGK